MNTISQLFTIGFIITIEQTFAMAWFYPTGHGISMSNAIDRPLLGLSQSKHYFTSASMLRPHPRSLIIVCPTQDTFQKLKSPITHLKKDFTQIESRGQASEELRTGLMAAREHPHIK